jgi:uncharacterized protein Usg
MTPTPELLLPVSSNETRYEALKAAIAKRNVFELNAAGFSLVTLRVFYFKPDHPSIVNPNDYLCQHYDIGPRWPVSARFLRFWQEELDGKVSSVEMAYTSLIEPSHWRRVDAEMLIN